MFSFDRLEPLDLHHQIKSLLLLDPVLLQASILLQLFVSNCVDSRCHDHSVHVLNIVIIFVHLVLSLGKKRVLAVLADFDF